MSNNTNENKVNIENFEDTIKQKNTKIRILILINIILIILLLLLYILGFRLGKIGYISTTSPNYVYTDIIEIKDDNEEWGTIEKELNIFSNSKFDNKNIIAPRSNEIYEFEVKNLTDENVEYTIEFEEDSKYNINMRYKLKLENVYIAGNEEEWVTAEELTKKAVKVAKNSTNIFTLEWKWLDNDVEDTYVGMQDYAEYMLKVSIKANIIENTKESKDEI